MNELLLNKLLFCNDKKQMEKFHTYAAMFLGTAVLILLFSFSFPVSGVFSNADAKGHCAPAGCKYYKSILVTYGDSLWSIAEIYRGTHYSIEDYINELKRINSLEEENIIAGMYLVVPYYLENITGTGDDEQ